MEHCKYCVKANCSECIWLKVELRLKPRPKHKTLVMSNPLGIGDGWFYAEYKRRFIDDR